MMTNWIRKPATLGLSLGATLMAAVFGCGGQATDSSDAVVVPDSTATPRPPRPRRPARPRRPRHRPRPPAATTPAQPPRSRPRDSARSRARSSSPAIPRRPRSSSRRARPPRTPRSAPRTPRSLSERLVVDGATKGVKNVLVYLPKPTSVNDDAKKAYAAATSHVRPEQVRLRAPRPGHDGRRADHARSRATRSTTTSTSSSRSSAFNQLLAPSRRLSSRPRAPSARPARSPAIFIPG